MMKSFVLILCAAVIVLPVRAFAGGGNPNDVPLYEGVNKTPKQIAADITFIKEVTLAAGSKDKAADGLVARGWSAITTGDLRTAVHRFNEAYLVKPEDYRAYWGLGVAAGSAGDLERSVDLFKRGAPLAGNNARFYCDYGFSEQNLAIRNAQQRKDSTELLAHAESLYNRCKDLDPKSALSYSHLAVIQFFKADCPEVKRYIEESRKRGGEGLDPRFLKDVDAHCP